MDPIRPRTVRISGAFLVYRSAARIAPDTVSRSEPGWRGGRFHRAITHNTPRYDAAFSENTVAIPNAAIRNPPSAGPIARARLNSMPLKQWPASIPLAAPVLEGPLA